MDSKEFYQRLSELTEWEIPKPVTSSSIRTDKDHIEEIYSFDPVTEEEVITEIDMSKNETLPVRIIKIKHQPKPCEDCGKTVTNRIISIRRYEYPQTHWRKYCGACYKTQNPFTGKYDLKEHLINNSYMSFFKQNK